MTITSYNIDVTFNTIRWDINTGSAIKELCNMVSFISIKAVELMCIIDLTIACTGIAYKSIFLCFCLYFCIIVSLYTYKKGITIISSRSRNTTIKIFQ